MSRSIKAGCVVAHALLLAFMTAAEVSGADYDVGLRAYWAGDYVTAVREWRPLAEQGDASAQRQLGALYGEGDGVPQSDSEAARWYRRAAEQGDPEAQGNLGHRYMKGLGVPTDYVQAYRWYDIATLQYDRHLAQLGDTPPIVERILKGRRAKALQSRERVARRMTPVEVAEARRLAREWKPRPEHP